MLGFTIAASIIVVILINHFALICFQVFSQSQIGSATLETTRESIGLNFQSVIQNVRALKRNDPILQQYPNIQWNIQNSVSRRNWLAHEYGTTAPIKWNEVADSVYDDLPVMKSSIIAALQANGIANP
jgi:hypothetical protein